VALVANEQYILGPSDAGFVRLAAITSLIRVTADGDISWPSGMLSGFSELSHIHSENRPRLEEAADATFGSEHLTVTTTEATLPLDGYVLDGRVEFVDVGGHRGWLLPDSATVIWEARPGLLVSVLPLDDVPTHMSGARGLEIAGTVRPATPMETSVLDSGIDQSTTAATYTVRVGDSWVGIAKKLGVTLDSLLAVNHATGSTALYPGMKLTVPG
jgi:hypothetical protein